MDLETAKRNLEARGYAVKTFPTGETAAEYLNGVIDGTSVGFGGSVTLRKLKLYERLCAHNTVFWHWAAENAERLDAVRAEVYLTSANALAQTGEIINIDGAGNRVSATLYGPKRVYFVIGRNKLAPDFEAALWRARNVAAPKNAQRLGVQTPCAVKGDRCYDCDAPGRICRGLVVLWRPMSGAKTEIILIDEDLGL